MLFCAGPATCEQLVMLDLCIDALKGTAAISDHRMQTLDSTLHSLKTLMQLQAALTQVSRLYKPSIGFVLWLFALS